MTAARRSRPPTRRRPNLDRPPLAARPDLSRARRECLRARTTTCRGLVYSIVLSIPVGGAYATSITPDDPTIIQECASLTSVLGMEDRVRLRERRVAGQLNLAQRRAMSLEVCDPTLIGLLPHLADLASNGEGFEEMAARFAGHGTQVTATSLLKALVSTRSALESD